MMTTLTATMTALSVADSRTPRTSTHVTNAVMSTAGTLNTNPPADAAPIGGAPPSATGSVIPNSPRRLTTLPDQPTATVAAPRAYSRIRSQPMTHATNSPSVAY